MRSRWTRVAVGVAAASLVLTACGRSDEGSDEAAEAAPVEEGPAEGTVTVWAMGAEGEALDVLAADFMAENPDATIEVTPVPWDAAHNKIATAIAAGETPDVSLIGTTWMGEFASTDALDPTPEELIDPARFFEGPWQTTVVDGTSYGVPWYTETRVLFYRSDLAEQAGFSEPPETWDDLKAMASGMQEAGAEWGISVPAGGTGSWQTFLPFAWQNGAAIATDGDITIDSPETVEAIEYYDSFFTEGLSPTALSPGALEQGFVDGTIGSFISGPWHMSILDDLAGEEFRENWAVAHLPEKDTATSFVGGGDMVVFADSDNRAASWKFVEYLTRPEVQQKWYEEVSALPTVSGAWESGVLAEDESLAVFGEQLEDAKSPPTFATWEQVANVIDSEMEQVTVGELGAGEAAAAMQQQIESIVGGR